MLALASRSAAAQVSVSGVAYDSLARGPLAGARIQLVSADDPGGSARSTTSDSLGRFAIANVPAGRYTVGFFHPVLDSLGLEAPLRAVRVEGSADVRVDVAVPGPASLRAAICGARPETDDGAVVVGVVRAAEDGTPVSGVAVTAQWVELAFTSRGLVRTTPKRTVTTAESGWFAVCDVPRAGTTTLVAARGADSTALVDVQVPAEGFARQALTIGRAGREGSAPSVGTLTGTVLDATSVRPLDGVQVRIGGATETRTNAQGEWTLPGVALGTRMLEVRAVGYLPERRPVDVVAGAAPLRLTLSSLRSVLDTVRITAAAPRLARAGFDERRRRAGGRYLTAEDVARRGVTATSRLFLSMPGVRLGFAQDTLETEANFGAGSDDTRTRTPDENRIPEPLILMRSGSQQVWCAPAIYIDGLRFPQMTPADIDDAVAPHEVAGIEVYTFATVPAQFAQAMTGCGSILIWRK
jgi:hypothetical protein